MISRSSVLAPNITLYVVRHGETDWNAAARYQGQRDIPLNDRGRGQARANGETLARLLPDVAGMTFVASPLGRARETMDILRRAMGLPPDGYGLDRRLVEVNYGHWEGQLAADLKVSDRDAMAARRSDPFHWRPRDGESYADLARRTDAWLGEVDRDTIVVTHGGVSRTLRGRVLGLPEADIPFLPVPQDKVLRLSRDGMSWL